MISYIRVVHISPETDRAGEILPHALILPDRLLTLFDKRRKAVLFDLLFSVQPQFLFHFQFHRKAMGIPSCLSRHHIPLHGPVSRDHIFDHAGQYMTDMGLAVCSRRAVIKCIGRAVFSVFH